jgi:hypothetical protein
MRSQTNSSPFIVTARNDPRIDWKTERERIDLAVVATNLLGQPPGRRRERGRKLWWHCPLGTHKDLNPSFCVEPGKRWWKCWGCGESGDAATLVMRVEGLTFPEAVESLTCGQRTSRIGPTRPATRPAPEPPPQPTGLSEANALALVEDAEARLGTPEGAKALAYLTGPRRCLTPETIRAARLGWTPQADGVACKPPGVVIPWFLGDRLALVKIRLPDAWRARFPEDTRPPKYMEAFRDPARLICYPSPATIRPGRPLVVVEGEFDALCLGEALGELAAVVTLGSASARPTRAILGGFLPAVPWFVSTDGDEAGDKAAEDWPARARRVRPPEPYRDWTEARADGVDLARWWRDVLSGNPRPPLFTWEDLSFWRWGSTVEAIDDPYDAIERKAIMSIEREADEQNRKEAERGSP